MNVARSASCLVGAAAVAVLVPLVAGRPTTTYGGASAGLLWAEAAACVALLVAGAVDSGGGRWSDVFALGLLWLVPELAGWGAGPTVLRTIAQCCALLLPAVAFGVVARRVVQDIAWRKALSRLGLAAGALAAFSRLLLVDPFLDARCWRNCSTNPLVLVEDPTPGRWLERGSMVVLGMVVLTSMLLLAVSGRQARLRPLPIAVTGVTLVGTLLTTEVLRWVRTEDAVSPTYVVAFLTTQVAAVGLAAAVAGEKLREWLLSLELTRLAGTLRSAPPPGALGAAVGQVVGDPALRIDYWVAGREMYVDAEGRPVSAPEPSRQVTTVARQGQRLARMVHGPEVDGERIDRALGAALRLALENEQLRAATLAELLELQTSRARVVERAAQERQRLERNLHDGAQQRVVALSLLMRMLGNRAADGPRRALAERAQVLTRAALDELRRVARGIYPAVLADTGLSGAVLDLAQTSTDVAVVIDDLSRNRYPGMVESTAYLVIAAALEDARERRAGSLAVSVSDSQGALTVALCSPGSAGELSQELHDQVGALLGELQVRPSSVGTRVRLVLPCAS